MDIPSGIGIDVTCSVALTAPFPPATLRTALKWSQKSGETKRGASVWDSRWKGRIGGRASGGTSGGMEPRDACHPTPGGATTVGASEPRTYGHREAECARDAQAGPPDARRESGPPLGNMCGGGCESR
jgi:hypothetical protein